MKNQVDRFMFSFCLLVSYMAYICNTLKIADSNEAVITNTSEDEVLIDLPTTISSLEISFSNISSLSFLSQYPNIKVLTLRNNVIKRQEQLKFVYKLNNLEELDLSNNSLDAFDFNWIKNNNNLRRLVLNDNPTMNLKHYIKLDSLEEISFYRCDLYDFPMRVLKGFKNLVHIGLQGNELEVLPNDLLIKFPKLDLVNIEDNLVECVENEDILKILLHKTSYMLCSDYSEEYNYKDNYDYFEDSTLDSDIDEDSEEKDEFEDNSVVDKHSESFIDEFNKDLAKEFDIKAPTALGTDSDLDTVTIHKRVYFVLIIYSAVVSFIALICLIIFSVHLCRKIKVDSSGKIYNRLESNLIDSQACVSAIPVEKV